LREYIIQEARRLVSEKNKTEIYVFGETHSHWDEVSRIRNKIVKLKPDIILHELWWEDETFYKKHLPNTKILPLEPSNTENRKIPKDLEKQFKVRETEMINTIKKVIKKYPDSRIAVVVGDTHLRTIPAVFKHTMLTDYLNSINAKIIRSKYSEIK